MFLLKYLDLIIVVGLACLRVPVSSLEMNESSAMRLIRTDSQEIEVFDVDSSPRYAILTHAWAKDDVIIPEIMNRTALMKREPSKLQEVCQWAQHDGLGYLWLDAICINPSYNTGRRKATSSTLRIYKKAAACYVLLEQVRSKNWFDRQSKLEELILPLAEQFFDSDINSSSPLVYSRKKYDILGSSSVVKLQDLYGHRPTRTGRLMAGREWDRGLSIVTPSTPHGAESPSTDRTSARVPLHPASTTVKRNMLHFCTAFMNFLQLFSSKFRCTAFCVSCVANSARPLYRYELLDALQLSGIEAEPKVTLDWMLEEPRSAIVENSAGQIVFRLPDGGLFIRNFGIAGIDASHKTLADVCRASLEERFVHMKSENANRTPQRGFGAYARQYVEYHAQKVDAHRVYISEQQVNRPETPESLQSDLAFEDSDGFASHIDSPDPDDTMINMSTELGQNRLYEGDHGEVSSHVDFPLMAAIACAGTFITSTT